MAESWKKPGQAHACGTLGPPPLHWPRAALRAHDPVASAGDTDGAGSGLRSPTWGAGGATEEHAIIRRSRLGLARSRPRGFSGKGEASRPGHHAPTRAGGLRHGDAVPVARPALLGN